MIPITKLTGRTGNQMFQYAYIYSQFREGKIPDLYLQDYKYFDKYENEIKQLFGTGIGFIPEVGIHYRKTDYNNNPFYVELDKTTYYQEAVALFPNDYFLVISDDIVSAKKFFCEQNFPNRVFRFSNGVGEIEDLNLFASTKHQIIANSSFSWWGAFLCPNPNHKVIYPKQWFSDGVDRVGCKPEWIDI